MRLKTILHFHSGEDPVDFVDYTIYEAIDHAASLGFEVLALTCHEKVVCSKEIVDYARSKNILLIPGIEIPVEKKHVIILNCDEKAEKIRNFQALYDYKNYHPEIFILAPHPYFYGRKTLKNLLEKHIGLFDAVEHSWFYSKFFNRNLKGEAIAKKYNKPFIATPDAHCFDFIGQNYAIVEASQKTTPAVFEAIKNKNFQNVSLPRDFFKDMVWKHFKFVFKSCFLNMFRRNRF